MDKVRLGRTDLKVKRLGLGQYSAATRRGRGGRLRGREVVEMGVDLLDTARGYTTSEGAHGMVLKKISRPVVLSSKSPVRTEKIYDEVHVSLKNLQVKKIHIYHLHNVSKMEDYEKVMGSRGAYEGLVKAKKRRFDRSYRVYQPQSGCHGAGPAETTALR